MPEINDLITSVEMDATGGGCYATLFTLTDGRVVVATNIDDSVSIYKSRAEWDDVSGMPNPEPYEDLTSTFLLIERGQ